MRSGKKGVFGCSGWYIRTFRVYLEGTTFMVQTDHHSLEKERKVMEQLAEKEKM